MKNKKFVPGITDIVLIVVSLGYLVLLNTVFITCGPKDDGSFMVCQWAWRSLVVLAVILVTLSIVHAFVPGNELRLGISIGIFTVAIASAVLPDNIIPLCMMNTMKCHTHTKPGNLVFSVLIAVASAFDIAVRIRKLTVKAVKQQEEI